MSQGPEKCNVDFETKAGIVLPASENHIEEAIAAVKAENVIAVPTDTIYGFACDAWYVVQTVFRFPSDLISSNFLFSYFVDSENRLWRCLV